MLAGLGFITLIVFITLILTKRLHVITALVFVPIAAGLLLGVSVTDLGVMMFDGIKTVAPTAIMIMFSVLFFGIMIDTGLFDPLIAAIAKFAKNDPVKIAIGTALLTLCVSLDGDGPTTFMIVTLAMLPLYRKVGMNPLILTGLAALGFYLMNSSPWGGPTARTMAVLDLGVGELFTPLIPAMIAGGIYLLFMAYMLGTKERKRLGYVKGAAAEIETIDMANILGEQDQSIKRPKLRWFNLLLVVGCIVCLVLKVAKPAVLFMVSFAIGIFINYRDFKQMEERITANSGNATFATVMMLAAGIFTGIFSGTKMIDAMAISMVTVIPEALSGLLPVFTAVISFISTLVMTPDSFYYGVVPVLAQTGAVFGIDPAAIGRAALLGQIGYGLSPLLASPLLLAALAKVNYSDHQRFNILWGFGMVAVMILAGVIFGVI
ncbi:CitMHS family citrate-Mg2+:H+ or citrate-Ca2+:H+ symporter [Desulfitobacterium sp. LBE]|uniref:CitMHS family transporter n=1 Tax=Desulfitobacterium sp. LBE TaxID=884086 RepID=UPI001198F532|nr:citrate:proton symporter [Desulfitobacterium sp. LBE]TWH57141.1 CitMHS family citrate-Mg2+:H+ or citrate-Ca2+:H+ symporter [Desulfitobacterium sp. LBE]